MAKQEQKQGNKNGQNGSGKQSTKNSQRRNNQKKRRQNGKKPSPEELAKKGNYQDAAEEAEKAKGAEEEEQQALDGVRKRRTNDPKWYATDPALLRDSASIPFSWVQGQPVRTISAEYTTDAQKVTWGNFVSPGLMTFHLYPTIGEASSKNSPVNVAATSMYSFIRHANSGHANYDAPDLMLYMLAWTSVYSFINFAQRVYGIAQLYAIGNRYLPDVLLRANGMLPEDVQKNLAQLRYGINVLINKCSALAVPATMSIFLRQSMLYQDVYVEGPSIKDQLYMMVPDAFFRFEVSEEGPGSLVYENWGPQTDSFGRPFTGVEKTVEQLLAFGNKLLNPILGDEDFGIMSGDILKAYGSNGIIQLVSLPENFILMPVYDEYVLAQFKNAQPLTSGYRTYYTNTTVYDLRRLWTPAYGPVTQNVEVGNTYLQQAITLNYNAPASGVTAPSADHIQQAIRVMQSDRLLVTDLAEATPEWIIEATRLMPSMQQLPKTNNLAVIAGTEVVNRCFIWKYNYKYDPVSKIHSQTAGWYFPFNEQTTPASLAVEVLYVNDYVIVNGNANRPQAGDNPILATMAKAPFKWSPATTAWESAHVSDNYYLELTNSDIKIGNYALMTPQMIYRLHETAVLNQLNVPSIAKAY